MDGDEAILPNASAREMERRDRVGAYSTVVWTLDISSTVGSGQSCINPESSSVSSRDSTEGTRVASTEPAGSPNELSRSSKLTNYS